MRTAWKRNKTGAAQYNASLAKGIAGRLDAVALFYLFARYGWDAFVPLRWYFLLVLGGVFFAWLPFLVIFMITGQFPSI
jgi:hypothetical protein